jgi:hypothetical protein
LPGFFLGSNELNRQNDSLPTDERWGVALVFALAAAPAWLRGGTHAPWTAWLPLVTLFVLATFVVFSVKRMRQLKTGRPSLFVKSHDPIFWLGFGFILLLLIQWLNAGRLLYYDSELRGWAYSPARIAWLPSAITPAEARQMLDWFLPAWVILLALRSPAMSSRGVRMVWRLLAYQAGLLALFGIIQYTSGTTLMYGVAPMRPHFFAAFGYPNHAGSYFLLAMGLAAGLLSWELGAGDEMRRWGRRAALAISFFLSFVSANLSLSRSAILLSWLLLFLLIGLLIYFLWHRLQIVQRVHLIAAGLAVLCLAMMLTIGLGRDGIKGEFETKPEAKNLVDRETSFRWFQITSAFRMWADQPLFGVGGWGYRYLIGHYVPPKEWKRITEGKANVHNDPVQFLVEFGVVGAGCMAAVTLILLGAARRARHGYAPLLVLPLIGVGFVWMQSLIDLPFRSPAVLLLWLICLAGASRVVPIRHTSVGKSVVSASA